MAITDYSETAGTNTSISGINIAESCPPSGINNAIRQLMADIATGLTSGTFGSIPYLTNSGAYTVVAANKNSLIDCTSALTLTLTAAATLGAGFPIFVKANGGAVTIDPNASETINGSATLIIADGRTALVVCDGSNWHTALISGGVDVTLAGTPDYITLSGQELTLNPIDLAADVTGDLPVAEGGTGASTAGDARTNLGLGSIATQAAGSVSITGGSISGITDLPVADGGTGASSAAGARTGLGVAIGSDVQAYDADLAAIAGLTSAADKLPYFSGSGTAALADLSAFGRTLIDDADAAAARTTLGVSGIPVGAVFWFAANSPPTDTLECNGAAISRTTYATLFTAISTVFGTGDGSTTFNLPDLRGEFVRGWDNSRGIDSGRAFGSLQLDALQGHFHNQNQGGTTGKYTPKFTGNSGANFNARWATNPTDTYNALSMAIDSPITDGVNGTPRTAAETRGRNVALLPCIKY